MRIIPKGDEEAKVSAVTKEAHGVDEFMLLGAENSFPRDSSGRKDCGQ